MREQQQASRPGDAADRFTFADTERDVVYRTIRDRRDVRRFRPEPIPDDVLARLLDAADHAPSVGYMQPWSFVVVRDAATRSRVKDLFERERVAAAQFFEEPRRSRYLSLKLEGILEAPMNLCVTCDPTRGGVAVIGRNSTPETDVYSTCLAVENFWLAARAEGVGVGWVSILKLPQLREIFGIPPHVVPVAYLCVGYPEQLLDRPELETAGWLPHRPLFTALHYERWGARSHPAWPRLDRLAGARGRSPAPWPAPVRELVARIGALDRDAMATARAREDELTKPQGSLGRLESVAVHVAGITGNARPTLPRKAVVVMAADHGVAAEGVSAYPQDVTAQMVLNFLRGGAGISVLARAAGARVIVVDMGVAADLPAHPDLYVRRVGRGTRNMAEGPAMSREEACRAIEAGAAILEEQAGLGLDLVATGEMGIANTTAASAIVSSITRLPAARVVGRGTGIDDNGLARKIAVIEDALALNRPDPDDALDVLAKVGGFEIAGLVGLILAAAGRRIPVVVDGFISGAAALVATEIAPSARDFLIAAHRSVEVGHQAVLERLALDPLLDLDLRLGEGTGAAIAMQLIDDALRVLDEMATFTDARVSGRIE
ncbi:MAG TPA: nicotinate-nucleotide--dimethylbenzimidazole phosphoribosyltransferase [Candidatus Limnocylindria bacterium]|nr:nicotinate-nucleotide--dimethylbenzimidazole phosphoribosyltransferase [Candidatus Limnocylindria bacterium]